MREIGDLLPASLAAFGAVLGLIVGATVASIVGWATFGPDSDLFFTLVGGLGGAVAFAWLGLRLSGRFANRNAKPS